MPRIRFGPAGKPISMKSDIVYAPRYLRSLGLSSMEYAAVRGINIDAVKARMLGEEARRNDVVLSLHAPYFINLSSTKREVVEASVIRLIEAVKVSAIMGAYIVVFHPGWYGDLSKREAVEKIVRNLREVAEYREQYGFRNVLLGIETTGKLSQVGDLDEVIEVSLRVEGTRPVIDFGHLYARAAGRFIVSENDVIKVVEKLEKNLGRESVNPLHVHFSKVEFNRSGEIRHRALNEKNYGPQFEYVCRGLYETGVDAVIISESPLLEQDALLMKKTCMDLCGPKCIVV